MFIKTLSRARSFVRPILAGTALALSLSFASPALAETIEVTDMAGRTVEVTKGVQRIVLGEGRMMYSVALLEKEDPFGRIVGWKDDLILFDPDAYRKYEALFPEAADIPNLVVPQLMPPASSTSFPRFSPPKVPQQLFGLYPAARSMKTTGLSPSAMAETTE